MGVKFSRFTVTVCCSTWLSLLVKKLTNAIKHEIKHGFSFRATVHTNKCDSLVGVAEFNYFCVRPIDPKLANTVAFPVYLALDYVPSLQFLEPVRFIIPLGVDSLAFIAVSHVSWVLKSRLGSEAAALRSPAHPLVLRCFIKVSSLVSMRRCPLCPLSAICDSVYSSKPHGFNESLKAAIPSAPLTGCPGFVLDWCTQNDLNSQNAQLVRWGVLNLLYLWPAAKKLWTCPAQDQDKRCGAHSPYYHFYGII